MLHFCKRRCQCVARKDYGLFTRTGFLRCKQSRWGKQRWGWIVCCSCNIPMGIGEIGLIRESASQ